MDNQLKVEVVVRAHNRESSVLQGWISQGDYSALCDGDAPFVVRMNDCQSDMGLLERPEDLYVRSAYILSIEVLDRLPARQSAMPR
ncbi:MULTISPECIES: hypothetical protein [Pseudomonadaceae]|uniref:Uncharacterized protein n=1 Tax=Pseudomonas denitrificans TaxID=43306 RepID=A0A9X7N5C9_PSEDE|nr:MULTISPECIES: hypothetical protein [Pseudomonadaceae]MBD9517734.1 hypothetical protein [Pseudomonas sp. PDM22]MBD9631906.1 hypothetical protein [Pseudomonas sp. PDM19]OQR34389.1 hypothetical protein BWR15_10355 [Pseudomonas sp. T]QEY75418.1 hypothetical protein F1C79_29455 [Pseudomonas denitrificans (nom. rej.)]